jgi:hypothetical protein
MIVSVTKERDMATAHPEITFARSLPLAARNGVLAL